VLSAVFQALRSIRYDRTCSSPHVIACPRKPPCPLLGELRQIQRCGWGAHQGRLCLDLTFWP
jgi:hypothetical protein